MHQLRWLSTEQRRTRKSKYQATLDTLSSVLHQAFSVLCLAFSLNAALHLRDYLCTHERTRLTSAGGLRICKGINAKSA